MFKLIILLLALLLCGCCSSGYDDEIIISIATIEITYIDGVADTLSVIQLNWGFSGPAIYYMETYENYRYTTTNDVTHLVPMTSVLRIRII